MIKKQLWDFKTNFDEIEQAVQNEKNENPIINTEVMHDYIDHRFNQPNHLKERRKEFDRYNSMKKSWNKSAKALTLISQDKPESP